MLRTQGLNLFAVLDASNLPEGVYAALAEAGVPWREYPSLILTGHGGNTMWREMQAAGTRHGDPVDQYSVSCTRGFIERCLGDRRHLFLYPGPIPIPLQQLGALAGWHHPSPLGIGVHPRYGPWFGYRTAVLVDAHLPPTTDPGAPPPCESCADKPCLAACPAAALSADRPPDLSACVDYRLAERSPCALQCKARLACPVGSEHRYDEQQLNHYYRRSLQSIIAYRAKSAR